MHNEINTQLGPIGIRLFNHSELSIHPLQLRQKMFGLAVAHLSLEQMRHRAESSSLCIAAGLGQHEQILLNARKWRLYGK